jgi:hypothetical protein
MRAFLALAVPLVVACGPAVGDSEPAGEGQGMGGGENVAGASAGGGGNIPQGGSGGEAVGGAPNVGGQPGAGGGTSPWVCGDGYCDPIYESCYWCAVDCGCGSGGSGAGGAPPGGGGGSGLDPAIQAAMDRAKAGVGFSYWWGHGAYLPQGPDASTAGSCSGSCPSCTHSGQYGGDCSGYVAKVWQVPASNTDLSDDSHPYATTNFNQDASQWSTIDQGSMKTGDAMVYNNGSAGHIFIYDHGDPWGSMYAYECKGCAAGCVAGMRTVTSAYHAIRRAGY